MRLQQSAPQPITFPVQVKAIGKEQFRARFAGQVEHGRKHVDVVPRWAGFDLITNQLVESVDPIDYGITRRAGLDRHKAEWDVSEGYRNFIGKRAKPAQNLIRAASVAEVVVAGVEHEGAWIDREYKASEKVVAGFERGSAESEVQDSGMEVLVKGRPKADGRTPVKYRRAISVLPARR